MASAEALLNEGRSLAIRACYSEAVDFLRFAAEKSPQDPRPLYLLAYCQSNLNENFEAEVSLNAASELERKSERLNWSQYMERVQGPKRAWLEAERRKRLAAKTKR